MTPSRATWGAPCKLLGESGLASVATRMLCSFNAQPNTAAYTTSTSVPIAIQCPRVRPTSAANMQKTRRLTKCATVCGSWPAELLRAVEHGGTAATTRHGKAIVHLTPAEEPDSESRRSPVERFREHRRQWRRIDMTTEEIVASIHEDRRW